MNKYLSFFFSLFLSSCGTVLTDRYHSAKQDIRGLVGFSEINYAGALRVEGSLSNFYPQEDFIEIKNYHSGAVDISGWVIELYSLTYQLLVLPSATVLGPKETLLITSPDARAFRGQVYFPGLELNPSGFALRLMDGGGILTADRVDFRNMPYIPAGLQVKGLCSSMCRTEDFFGALPADDPAAWYHYYPDTPGGIQTGWVLWAGPGLP